MSGLYSTIPGSAKYSGLIPMTGNEIAPFDTELPNGQSPQTATYTSSQIAGFSQSRESIVAGQFYGVPGGVTPTALLTVTGTLYAYPFYVNNDVQLPLKTIGLSVTTGQTGGAARVGIYTDNKGRPGTLITGTDAGALAATATANVSNTLSTTVTLNAGKYWLASIFTASGTFPSVAGSGTGYFTLGESLGADTQAHLLATSAQGVTGISATATYGALPATFPTTNTLTLNAGTPLVALGF
jgi:hypothetical protein